MSWICTNCETENSDSLKVCEVCDSPRSVSPLDRLRQKYNNDTYKNVIRYRPSLLDKADKGDTVSQYILAEWFRSHNSQSAYREEAVIWYTRAAKGGHHEAMYQLGECYANGLGVYSNNNEAINWFKKAANGGNKAACQKLAESYLYGWLVDENVEEAVKWYKQGEIDISSPDLYNIGLAYNLIDKPKAIEYYRKAAARGHVGAKSKLESIEIHHNINTNNTNNIEFHVECLYQAVLTGLFILFIYQLIAFFAGWPCASKEYGIFEGDNLIPSLIFIPTVIFSWIYFEAEGT